jgi:alpha,alpha-trehalose-phosphate synthase [UDP-forming]
VTTATPQSAVDEIGPPYRFVRNEPISSEEEFCNGTLRIGRIVVASNRLPVVVLRDEYGETRIESGSGGLVTALSPVVRKRRGVWIGWPGTSADVSFDGQLNAAGERLGCNLEPILLSQDEIRDYYLGFSNQVLWPLFHGLESHCDFDPVYWNQYRTVNRKFARAIADNSTIDDYIWVQDYHLLLVAEELRRASLVRHLGFFLHTPFPSPRIFWKLPWHDYIIKAMHQYDLVGFQTLQDRNDFIQCSEAVIKDISIHDEDGLLIMKSFGNQTRVGIFPISIDFEEFSRAAARKTVKERVAQLRSANEGQQIILGVDRLDYSKGIPLRLKAFGLALERFGTLRGKVTFIQFVVPSREGIPEYQRTKAEIEGHVDQINNRFARPGWVPVQYMFRSLERSELIAYYCCADVALVTPIRDGMNLVAKEYCAANLDENGVLILSEFAGAASQLRRNAILVNPYDAEQVSGAIRKSLDMALGERRLRMRRLRNMIKRRDIHWWTNLFFQAAGWSPCEFTTH